MISKELLSEVLGYKINNIDVQNNYIIIDYLVIKWNDNRPNEINIYELAHKCKEWAFSLGLTVETCKKIKIDIPITFIRVYCNKRKKYLKEYELSKTELYEADIRACQWVLDNKDTL